MPKPICCACNLFYRPAKLGVTVMEGRPISRDVWLPYKLWQADRWKCQGCGHELITGFGRDPISEGHKPDFQDWVKSMPPERQINDC